MPEDRRPKVAIIATVDRPKSHTDVLISRWLEPRPGDAAWGWPRPRTRIASIYLTQFPHNDLGKERCRKHNIPLCESVHEALTLGTDSLAVDGVVMVGEHGQYPWNDFGQHLYPRKELFDAIVETFRKVGKVVPVFCDKHYSWNADWAREMVDTAADMGFLLFGGSTLPLVKRVPYLALTGKEIVERAAFVYYGDDDAYGYHSMEFAQSILEWRQGAETGIRNVTGWRGIEARRQINKTPWLGKLIASACDAARNVNPRHVVGDNPQYASDPTLFLFEYRDGARIAHINLTSHLTNWTCALEIKGESKPRACAAVLAGEKPDYFAHFATLASVIEETIITGNPPCAVERPLLTTGAIDLAMQARSTPGVPLDTPQLAIAYTPTPQYNPMPR